MESTGDAGRFLFRSTNGSASNIGLLILEQNEAIFNEDSNDIDFRVESANNTHAFFVNGAGTCNVGIGRTPVSTVGLDLQGSDSGTFMAARIRNSSTNANAAVKQTWSLNRTGSDVDFSAADITVGKVQEWGTTPATVDGYMAFNVIEDENLKERIKITAGAGVQTKSGFLGNSHDASANSYWSISTFNDNAHVTSGALLIYTSNVEWQPNLLRITVTSIDTDQTDFGNARFYVRIASFNGVGALISTVDSWTSGSISISVTAQTISSSTMQVNIVATGTGNRTTAHVEALSYSGVFDAARTG